jgi:ketosteroid isomerase-like protein
MSELDDFLTPTLARQLEAEKALINGDPGPRLAMWSTQEPVTVFGAEQTVIGSEEARQVFRWLATRFSNLTDYRFELVATGASGDLAYTVGYEHITVSMDGGPVAPLTLRVTHLYRREDGEWKIVHRHADAPRPVHFVPPTPRRSRHHGSEISFRSTIFVSTNRQDPVRTTAAATGDSRPSHQRRRWRSLPGTAWRT